MAEASKQNGPRIYADKNGGLYVKADELFRSEKVKQQIEKMAEIFETRENSSESPVPNNHEDER